MIKPIVHDPMFLAQKSADAVPEDIQTAADLAETLAANKAECVGMAANMIGIRKRIIAFYDGENCTVMFNPEITEKSGEYEAEEGCLSLSGIRKTKRYNFITVSYRDKNFKKQSKKYFGWTARIIQHEIDHCNGILI